MKILLKAATSNEYYDEANCLLVELDTELIKDILTKRELFQMVKGRDKTISELCFRGIPGLFYADDRVEAVLGGRDYQIVPDDFEIGSEEVRTEVDRTLIMEDGVYFAAGIKHTSVDVESQLLSYDILLGASGIRQKETA